MSDRVVVMDRYEVRGVNEPDAFLGEGAFSMVWKAYDTQNEDKLCAVKTYKVDPKDRKGKCVALVKFKRQIEVLEELSQPLDKRKNSQGALWSEKLALLDMRNCFLQLYDYSRDSKGTPGMHHDGGFYVITELASYSLQDYLADSKERDQVLSIQTVANIAYEISHVVSALHVKGLVHLDIKPENIMKINGFWKLIDVDGCVKTNEQICIDDAAISFSPVYCSPEFAKFPIGDLDYLTIKDTMDVWSVALCFVELVLQDVWIGSQYSKEIAPDVKFDAGFAILEWLSTPEPFNLPQKILKYNDDYVNLVLSLLEKDVTKRKTLAEILDHPFFQKYADKAHTDRDADEKATKRNALKRAERHQAREQEKKRPFHNGVLYKLNSDGDIMRVEHWLKRDFWLARNGGLCYFSKKENRAQVLLDSALVKACVFVPLSDSESGVPWAFEVQLPCMEDGVQSKSEFFAAVSESERTMWLEKFKESTISDLTKTANFRDVKAFRLRIRNLRKKINEEQGPPRFKAELIKLGQDGDVHNPEDWWRRDMWVAQNGSLCYWSKKENRVLMYQSADDIRGSTLRVMSPEESCKENAFEMQLPLKDGMEFEPCVFCTDTSEERDMWIRQLMGLCPP